MFKVRSNPIDTLELLIPYHLTNRIAPNKDWRICKTFSGNECYAKAFRYRKTSIRFLQPRYNKTEAKLIISPASEIGTYAHLTELLTHLIGVAAVRNARIKRIDLKMNCSRPWRILRRIIAIPSKKASTEKQLQEHGFYIGRRRDSFVLFPHSGGIHHDANTHVEFRITFAGPDSQPLLRDLQNYNLLEQIPAVQIYRFKQLPRQLQHEAKNKGLHTALKEGHTSKFISNKAIDEAATQGLEDVLTSSWDSWISGQPTTISDAQRNQEYYDTVFENTQLKPYFILPEHQSRGHPKIPNQIIPTRKITHYQTIERRVAV